MLKYEDAEKRLKAFQIKDWEKTRVAELLKLPANLRAVGCLWLDRDEEGKPWKDRWEKRRKAYEAAEETMAKSTAKDREKLFGVLFPKLAKHIEGGWQLWQKMPYEIDYDRKGFRAPTDPTVHKDARWNWVQSLVSSLKGYDEDVVWCAAWSSYVTGPYGDDQLGYLFAAAIDAGGKVGDEVFEILKESATNQHEIGAMGRHVTRGLLAASRPEGWEYVEKLLMAAQRQEGLRQVILESVDEAHPEAFRRMVKLILDNNLLRFSATVRALDVWFGLNWLALTPAVLKKTLETTYRFMEDKDARAEALAKEKGEPLYLALWTIGFEDAHKAVDEAVKLLKDKDVERRFLGVHLIDQLGLPHGKAKLVEVLDDEDLRIAVKALEVIPEDAGLDLWDKLVALLGRMPSKREEGKPLVWPWATVTLNRKDVAGKLIEHRGKRPATTLLPFIHQLESYDRGRLVDELAKMKTWDAATRDTLFDLVGDRDNWVRDKALAALKKCTVTEADAQRVEVLLNKKGSDLRQGVLTLLMKRKPNETLESADRLLTSKKAPQRLGGLELMRLMVEKKRAVAECRQRAEAFKAKYPKLEEMEELHLEAILDVQRVKPSLKDGFGLFDAAQRSKAVEPVARKVTLCSAAAMGILQGLDKLIHENRQTPVTITQYGDTEEQLLGNIRWGFPDPITSRDALADAQKRLPLFEMWKDWFEKRPKKLQDADGLELLRASVWYPIDPGEWKRTEKQYKKDWGPWLTLMLNGQTPVKLKYPQIVSSLVQWLMRLYPVKGGAEFLLDAIETGFAHVPDELRKRVVNLEDYRKRDRDWRVNSPVERWITELSHFERNFPKEVTDEHRLRYWDLMHWRDEPAPGVARQRPDLEYLIVGFKAGKANETDVLDSVIGPGDDSFDHLRSLTIPNNEHLKKCPELEPIVERVKERVLEIELKRGEMPTAATEPAKAILSLYGVPTLVRVLQAIGQKAPARNTYGEGRIETFTHLVEMSMPGKDDMPEGFAAAMKAAGVKQDRLLQLAFVAPAWLDHVEHALGWQGLKEGVWWFLAHMPGGNPGVRMVDDDDDYDFDEDDDFEDEDSEEESAPRQAPLNAWEKIIQERTALTPEQRGWGGVDAAWFHRVYAPLGKKRWDALAEVAKYGCSGAGQKKAIRLSEVLLGKAKKNELVADIRDRKLKESARLLGLMPLPEGEKREPELLSRYKVLVEYRRYTRSLSPMSREDAERAATISLENLALTAGYPDPLRLEWAMEAKQIADLAQGPVSVTAEGVTVTLSITEDAQPELTIRRGEKPLKGVPAAAKQNAKVANLLERRTDLKRQASRVRHSLEAMMVRGDTFTGHELRQLFSHPLLRPVLERLVIVGEGIRGYPVADGQALEDYAGKKEPVKKDEKLRLAHAHDLYAAGDWDKWQRHCFQTEKVQKFKQVFRELYVVTDQEKTDGTFSHRYAGQQVQPRQAMALFGSRGWNARDEVTKTFRDEGIVAEVLFRHHGWTPAQVEGLTLEDVRFQKVGEYGWLKLTDVPPRLFSEVMRDCDLVVSVAHVGGVDPEASASTTQMREALVRETCALLSIANFKIAKTHVVIDGKLGTYTVHLGSGVVHRQPGGHVCIVPVHAQHRGRLFLPFADDDPRTAEVISKVLLLARDHEIQDPTILEQLRS